MAGYPQPVHVRQLPAAKNSETGAGFFDDYLKAHPGDADLVKRVKDVLKNKPKDSGSQGELKFKVFNNTLIWELSGDGLANVLNFDYFRCYMTG
ncbi:hypothetical protein DAEQUDRAFT_770873 [Daedalea quercina L-15889]|uniref:Uncharacterized protein n=1 Tax=Daedalea quercina L-15889 TaxID=1314783 RepID=A0A165KHM1_9APHY|nr:hypothetical protein DAEQUDRAFT_770873 [Daedalea quercina L-15889]